MTSRPFFSIVIPTKDRPECVRYALESLKVQSFTDFEVIVSDNAAEKTCKKVFDEIAGTDGADSRFHYFRLPYSMGMSDSFEAAINHAKGQWVMMIGDKEIVYKDSLQKVYNAIVQTKPDILNFGQDYLQPMDASRNMMYGKLKKSNRTGRVSRVSCSKALRAHLSCRHLMASTEPCWYVGCIFNGGVYNRSFIEKVRSIHNSGRIFDGIIPDRYGAAEALCIAQKVVWLDDNIIIYGLFAKNTWASTVKKGIDGFEAFVKESRRDKDYSKQLLVPGVIASVNNLVASDYYNAINNASSHYDRYGENHIDLGYLIGLIDLELRDARNISDEVIAGQRGNLYSFIDQLNDSEVENFKRSRKMILHQRRRSTFFGLKPRIDKVLRSLSQSKSALINHACTELLRALSKNTVIVSSLAEIVNS